MFAAEGEATVCTQMKQRGQLSWRGGSQGKDAQHEQVQISLHNGRGQVASGFWQGVLAPSARWMWGDPSGESNIGELPG